jgi:tetratricopeptide (TPR) repeat protein
MEPHDARYYTNFGIFCVAANHLEAALSHFSMAIELDSGYFLAYVERGRVYEKKHLYGAAIEDYTKAIEIYPKIWSEY